MGYFANGTEGEMFEEKYCSRCRHNDPEAGCPVLHVHMLYNYDQHDLEEKENILQWLIPRDVKGSNQECSMFIEREAGKGNSPKV